MISLKWHILLAAGGAELETNAITVACSKQLNFNQNSHIGCSYGAVNSYTFEFD